MVVHFRDGNFCDCWINMNISETIPEVWEAVQDTIKYKAVLFHIWMQKNHPTETEKKAFILYDLFELEYRNMMETNPKKEI